MLPHVKVGPCERLGRQALLRGHVQPDAVRLRLHRRQPRRGVRGQGREAGHGEGTGELAALRRRARPRPDRLDGGPHRHLAGRRAGALRQREDRRFRGLLLRAGLPRR